MHRALWAVLALGLAAIVPSPAVAVDPVDPDLIPEARRLLEYLHSIEGSGILAGMQRSGGGQGPFPAVLHKTGREPALYGQDIAGFHPKGSEIYHQVLRGVVENSLYWWREKGGVLQMLYHWSKPEYAGSPRGTAWKRRPADVEPPDIGRMITPGTAEYEAFHRDLSFTADYLERLAEVRVPVLFSPLHEIDGGWFWWTDEETPENTAALYRQVFHYLVKERKIHNLIWVYHAAHRCGRYERMVRQNPKLTLEDEIAHRARFYPGDPYVDVASLSTYPNPRIGWRSGWEDAREQAYAMMRGIAPGKPLAINETPQPIHPLIAQREGANWLWSRSWYSNTSPVDWLRYTFNHPHMITLDELPLLHGNNVMPNVRIDWPTDGLELERGELHLAGVATDRNGNLESVTIHTLAGPWMDWVERWDDAVKQAFAGSQKLGEARLGAGGRWTFTWRNPPHGYHQVVVLARDTEGAVATSNVVRLAVGIEDLARGRPATASTTSPGGGPPAAAVDGDLSRMWWADHREADPQWLQVDLGSEKRVGAVSVLWWKAYATNYTVQVSGDGEQWREVARVEDRQKPLGDADLIRFDPAPARYVRLLFTDRAVTGQAYRLYRFAVYERLP